MNRIRKDSKGVSPVIATILMVAITVVLAGVLVVYLQTLPTGAGKVETQVGLTQSAIVNASATAGKDWSIGLAQGDTSTVDLYAVVTNAAGGQIAKRLVPATTGWSGNADFDFYINGAAGRLRAGDAILIHGTQDMTGMAFSLLRGSNTIAKIEIK
ncbi:MAG: type IV pilin [Euryarchaeota archaeon]|nr:type IV pilin [Euryarchaeota archaeon]